MEQMKLEKPSLDCVKDMIDLLMESQPVDWKKRDIAKLLINHLNQHVVKAFHPLKQVMTEADWDNWYERERELVARRVFVRQIGLADRADGRPHNYHNLPEYVWYGPPDNRKILKWYSEAYDGGYRGETGKPPEEFLRVEQALAGMPARKLTNEDVV